MTSYLGKLMSIWKRSLASLDFPFKDNLVTHLGIEFIEQGEDFLKAKMPVDQRTIQPFGLLHGGASVVLAETLGSVAAQLCCEEGLMCVGLEVNANHIRAVRSGHIVGVATPVHLGRTTQVWCIQVSDQGQKVVCVARLTISVIKERGITL